MAHVAYISVGPPPRTSVCVPPQVLVALHVESPGEAVTLALKTTVLPACMEFKNEAPPIPPPNAVV